MIMESAWWKSVVWVSRLETQQSWWYRWSLLFGEAGLFFLFRLSSDWVRPAHIMEGNLFYSKYPDSNISLNKNIIQADTQN